MASTPRSAARSVHGSRGFRIAARLGYVVNGILNIAIGVLAIGIAVSGAAGGSADPGGALQRLAALPGGQVLIWVIVAGFAGLALWHVVEAVLADGGDSRRKWASRLRSGGKAVAYLALAVIAAGVALGGGSGGGAEESATADALATPGGVVLIVVVGLVAVGIGGYLVAKGVKRRFLDDIRRPPGRAGTAATVLGVTGYVARGIAVGVIGILFIAAAVTHDASQAGGLDDSLAALAALPFGQVLLVAIAIGFMAYGVYSLVRARYAKL